MLCTALRLGGENKTTVDSHNHPTGCDADSSYDSDDDQANHTSNASTYASGATSHGPVSRTTSDTLHQEFADYVNQPAKSTAAVTSNGYSYTQRVEFALKLGYTERLVQAALARLGPQPAQNELLAELIKLGSQPGQQHGDEFAASPTNVAAAAAAIEQSCMNGATTADSYQMSFQSTGQQQGGQRPPFVERCTWVPLPPGETEPHIPRADPCVAHLTGLRPIVIDGSNLAMAHGNKETFSCRGIKLAVDWFRARGHREITVFVPKYRKESPRLDNPIRDQQIMLELEQERQLVFTPSRFVNGKRKVCYDDRYILKLAYENDGIVVSNDCYRDLTADNPEFRRVVDERLLMYSFVTDRFMPPDDPLGRSGPTLENFLRMPPSSKRCAAGSNCGGAIAATASGVNCPDAPPPCPYGKKCTYGNKCKFNHPERGCGPHKTVTERLSEHAARHLQARRANGAAEANGGVGGGEKIVVQGKSLSVPLNRSCGSADTSPVASGANGANGPPPNGRRPLARARSGMPGDCSSSNNSSNGSAAAGPYNGAYGDMQMMQQQHQQQQQQQSPPTAYPSQQPFGYAPPPCWDGTFVPKSHSIDNISREMFTGYAASSYGANGGPPPMWMHQQQQQQQQHQQQQYQQHQQQLQSSPRPMQQSSETDCASNIHQALRRQLTLNPAGCDPRIGQMQQQQLQHQLEQQHRQHQQQQLLVPPHQPLSSTLSVPRCVGNGSMQRMHEGVTRIASAPDPSMRGGWSTPAGNRAVPNSNSDPQIGGGGGGTVVNGGGCWQPHHQPLQQQPHPHPLPTHQSSPDRRHLHYHLSSIFPEEQVRQAMQMYPDESNPQTICAAILSMFPKI